MRICQTICSVYWSSLLLSDCYHDACKSSDHHCIQPSVGREPLICHIKPQLAHHIMCLPQKFPSWMQFSANALGPPSHLFPSYALPRFPTGIISMVWTSTTSAKWGTIFVLAPGNSNLLNSGRSATRGNVAHPASVLSSLPLIPFLLHGGI